MEGNVLTITHNDGYGGDFYVQVSVSDGANTEQRWFCVSTTGAASLQSSAAEPVAVGAAANASSPNHSATPSDSPDLRAVCLNYFAENLSTGGAVAATSADLLASRFGELETMLRDGAFAELSSSGQDAVGSEDDLLEEIVGSLSAIRREVDSWTSDAGDELETGLNPRSPPLGWRLPDE